MVVTQLQTEALSQLCSKDQLDLLDSIDQLRSEGINNYVSLPQIIVCGDQSAGKSSVLEAISGVSFPVQSNTCTRFPTELILRRTPQDSSKVSIVPHASRTEAERLSLCKFREELEGFDGLGEMIEAAKLAMGIHTRGKTFSRDLLRIEITGPQHPHLTIVDLPGLIHSATKNQTDDDVVLIKDVVREYIISAKNDLANQIVLKMAKEADPAGQRTMGIITKPDCLISGSGNEKFFASLAQNEEVEFRLGWHVLKNLDSEKGSFSSARRDREEEEFFSVGTWQYLPAHLLGISELRTRLSNVLMRQIASELPSLVQEIGSKLRVCHERLENMGQRRATKEEQQLYLVKVSLMFQALTKAAIDGTYNNPFFEDAQSDRGYCQRARAVIQNSNQQFARDLSARGHYRQIVELQTEGSEDEDLRGSVQITRDAFITHIQNLMFRTRGRELPGTFSPMIVEDLFREQCRPWEAILRDHVETVAAAARELLSIVCTHIADDTTSSFLIREIVDPALESIMKILQSKADELLQPHKNGHPITYNHYFTETLQKVRDERRMADVRKALAQWLDKDEDELDTSSCNLRGSYNLRGLMEALASRSEPDMDRFAASEALDCMEAYYKVALKRFMDDVAIELVEAKLVQVLPDIFSPMTVWSMSPDVVGRIAGESDEKLRRREQLEKQIEVLGKGSVSCKRFVGMKLVDVIIDGARGAEATSEEEPVSEEEESISAEEPASEVDTDFGGPRRHHSPERVASPDFGGRWASRSASPVDEEVPAPMPYRFRG
ncbi:Interferon-induced GTP-binding protein Mx [Diaporthe amygdali]|uniref:Interferon-induced GTP-binding protein Mx n=1 Tax=Phomopsis amygdali TaxID=1214568 RepID=UPI0022FE6BBB|nr:Interferon-induced GTP-binding protein Mx [Diaporthe amygdali]KAJ0117159.1 Interferon-induced GTP-binding protein Mx [Diaporthe amygdali]